MDIKQIVYDNIKDSPMLREVDNLYDLLAPTVSLDRGDITLPCFTLAKTFHMSPNTIAENIKSSLSGTQVFTKIECVNGYLNFFLDRAMCEERILDEATSGVDFAKVDLGHGDVVIADYSSVNLAKYMHIGHLSTTIIGQVVCNLYAYLGYDVKRLNYVGDYGTPFGKMVAAVKRWGSLEEIKREGIDKIQDYYVRFTREAEDDPSLLDEAREYFKKIEENDPETREIYDVIISKSKEEVESICNILGVKFDSWIGEAYYQDKMAAVVKELDDRGLTMISEGAKIVDLSDYGLGVSMINKSDNTSLYVTRDLTAIQDRYNRYHFSKAFYVTSVQQKLHFERLFKLCELLERPYAKDLVHIYYGTYSLSTGKISSRLGKQALIRDMLDLAISRAREVLESRGTKTDDIEALARNIGVGAVIFSVLKTERTKDAVFDMDRALSFDGETSPYMQYTYARCCSIISKSGSDISGYKDEMAGILDSDSYELLSHINKFRDILVDAAKKYEPSVLSKYLLELCSLFNKFYSTHRIIENDTVSHSRLAVVLATRNVLFTGLKLLNITPVEKM